MGALMREYWLPAALATEVATDGPPLRLMLLGERLLAFRDTQGRVGVLDQRCPHRGASLFYGRNEQNGLRCVYHGWKFDAEGACVDMPSVAPHLAPARQVRARAYHAVERNGLIWVYMGAQQAAPPPLPFFADLKMNALLVQRECNWLQALEGDIDTSHLGFLHMGALKPDDLPNPLTRLALTNRAPEFEVADTEWGVMYGAFREADAATRYWRFANFLFPFWSLVPSDRFTGAFPARAWVPMDDTHTMFVQFFAEADAKALLDSSGKRIKGARSDFDYLPNTTDWFGRWRLAANAANDYRIDRGAQQRNESYTGIDGVHLQDQAMTESMGAVVDHSLETLISSDVAIARTRRRLLDAALALVENGAAPPGRDNPGCYEGARSGPLVIERAKPLMESYAEHVRRLRNPASAAE